MRPMRKRPHLVKQSGLWADEHEQQNDTDSPSWTVLLPSADGELHLEYLPVLITSLPECKKLVLWGNTLDPLSLVGDISKSRGLGIEG